jgi:hypothetical protein
VLTGSNRRHSPCKGCPAAQAANLAYKAEQQVLPFIGKLPTCHFQHDVIAPGTDFAAAEGIATSLGLGCDDFEISIYRGAWRCVEH